MSYNAFAHGIKKRNYKRKERLYHCTDELYFKKFNDIPLIEYESLWAFYKEIGFDHKHKKWLT